MYSPAQHKLLTSGSGSWVPVPDAMITYSADPSGVQQYRFHSGSSILSFLTSPTAGKLYLIGTIQPIDLTWTTATTTPYVDYSDSVSNFVRLGSDRILWVTIAINIGDYRKTVIPTGEITVANDEIQDIALSGDVATIFYGTRIKYLKHSGYGEVDQLFEKTITSTDIDFDVSSLQYQVKFSCICASMKRFACFSSTLNCLIVKKGGAACSTEGVYDWVPVEG